MKQLTLLDLDTDLIDVIQYGKQTKINKNDIRFCRIEKGFDGTFVVCFTKEGIYLLPIEDLTKLENRCKLLDGSRDPAVIRSIL
jgi:hypothetical protein